MHRRGLLAVLAAVTVLCTCAQAQAANTIGDASSTSGGASCTYDDGATLIQTDTPSGSHAAPYDGVLTSWAWSGFWSTVTFKVARLAPGGSFDVLASDGPRTHTQFNELESHPIRTPVRQGDVIGGYVPPGTYNCPPFPFDWQYGAATGNVATGSEGFLADSGAGRIPIQAIIERDRDGDGFGDESQDACPTNVATAGPCPLPTTLGETFTPVPSAITGDVVKTGGLGLVVAAQQDGVITSWSYQAGSNVEGTLKLKMFRPLGVNDYRAVGADQARAPAANALNTYTTRIPVRQGDKIGVHAENIPVSSNVSAPQNSTAFFDGDLADGSSATFIPSTSTGRRTDISAVLEADVDVDGFGDTSQDACPTDASTQAACSASPDAKACEAARKKLKKAKAKLKKLKRNDAAAKKIKKAKKKVKRAKRAVKAAC
jgi:hypothetical protein